MNSMAYFPHSIRGFRSGGRARGVALVVVLLFLLAVTGLVLFSARSALLGETLARNQLDEQLARQAAESALRDAEQDLMQGAIAPANAVCDRGVRRPIAKNLSLFTANCLVGQCAQLPNESRLAASYSSASASSPGNAEPWWPISKGGRWSNDIKPSRGATTNCDTFTGGVPIGTFTGSPALAGVFRQPEYLIEKIERVDTYFRVTARGFGAREGTEIVVQSYVLMPSDL
jgi:type IV pilus assembly protein PilX